MKEGSLGLRFTALILLAVKEFLPTSWLSQHPNIAV
jgi:hypothetical protein